METAEKLEGNSRRICFSSLQCNTINLTSGNKLFVNQSWISQGINVIGNLCRSGLFTFQQLKNKFVLPASSFFIYLRCTLKAYGVPWRTPPQSHPILGWARSKLMWMCFQNLSRSVKCNQKTIPCWVLVDPRAQTMRNQLNWDVIWSNWTQHHKMWPNYYC